MALGQLGTEDTNPTSVVSPEDTINGLATIPADTPGYLGLIQQYMGDPQESQSEQQPEPAQLVANHTSIPESEPLMTAIDHGVADKKFAGPHKLIREGIESWDTDKIMKGHDALSKIILGPQSLGEWYNDSIAGHGNRAAMAKRIAGDIVLKEVKRATGLGMPSVEEASRLGLIDPNELLANQQTQEYAHLIPAEPFQMDNQGMPVTSTQMRPEPAQPGQEGITGIKPGAHLTPLQQDIAESRQKGLQSGLAYKAALAGMKGEAMAEQVKASKYKREVEGPKRIEAMRHLDALRTAQTSLANARVEWYTKLPQLRKDLAATAGSSPFEIDAVKRVYEAIKTKQPIQQEDWLIASKWLTKGSPQFGADFMGNPFNKYTGKSGKGGVHPGFLGIPEPPDLSLSPDEQDEATAAGDDMAHQLGEFFRSLLQGVVGGDKAKETELPTPKTPEEAHKLAPGTRYRRPDGKEMVR